MATNLTSVFGNAIKVFAQPRRADRQYVGLPGAHGLISMNMGTRGRQIIVTGRLATYGVNYSTARENCQAIINNIEAYCVADADTYVYYNQTFYNTILADFQLIPDTDGKLFHWTSGGFVTADFVAYLYELL